jgi:hypothetical protein
LYLKVMFLNLMAVLPGIRGHNCIYESPTLHG